MDRKDISSYFQNYQTLYYAYEVNGMAHASVLVPGISSGARQRIFGLIKDGKRPIRITACPTALSAGNISINVVTAFVSENGELVLRRTNTSGDSEGQIVSMVYPINDNS